MLTAEGVGPQTGRVLLYLVSVLRRSNSEYVFSQNRVETFSKR
jgi:hypothetical protein